MVSVILLITYIVSVIVCYICNRKSMPDIIEKFYELIIVIIMMFLPFINIIFSIVYLIIYYNKKSSEENVKELVNKIFKT